MEKTPAEIVIEKFGGHTNVARAIGVNVSRVYRWTYPPERGGTGGIIPSKHQQNLLERARALGIALTADDFFRPAPSSTEAA